MVAKRPTLAASVPVVMLTTAATVRRPVALTVVSRILVIVRVSARPAKQIPVIVLLLFRFLLTPAARHIFQPVLQSVPPGPAIPVTPSPEVFAQNSSATSVR